jgi:23S rRNA 5-hydroxycytidine C2501 synthase
MKIELLSPAKDKDCGINAIDYGADAVYIGAPKFGARLKASNSIEDIQKLIEYAHKFSAKVYPVLNTVLFENELEEAELLINQLYGIMADAIIIQDMGILEMKIPPIPLFASTQTHNYSLDRIKFLESVGLKRIILARELSLEKISEIRKNTSIELEFFIHGALCVSFSGQCYFSEAITKRSANRGQCSQPCRMKYNLFDLNGKMLVKNKNLLSLKDLNLSDYIGNLIDVGISSFKIEGRLKDSSYVKNVTAYYRKIIDVLIDSNHDLQKSSAGKTEFNFIPNPEKSFNRSFTSYYINNSKRNNVASIDTEKSLGEQIGKIKTIGKDFITIDSTEELHNGDGICFFINHVLQGTNVNKVTGNKIFLNDMSDITLGIIIYRNYDIEFDKFLNKNKLSRRLKINFAIEFSNNYLSLNGQDENGNSFLAKIEILKNTNERVTERIQDKIKSQLQKTGGSIFVADRIDISGDINFNIPLSVINQLRRDVISGLEEIRLLNYKRNESYLISNNILFPETKLDYKSNITNSKAKSFYLRHGVKDFTEGFELLRERTGKEIMRTKYCIRYELGKCPILDKSNSNEPLYLENNKRKYRVEFDCKECQMRLILC